jgi:hypothetical protein
MRKTAAILIMAGLMAGCAAQVPSTEVTRFHAQTPLSRGTITIAARDDAEAASMEFAAVQAAVSDQLTAAGYTVVSDKRGSNFVAQVSYSRAVRPGMAARSPVSVGLGGGTGGGGFGLGGGISFPIGKPKSTDIVSTELFVQIRERASEKAVWEGRAQSDAREGTPYASVSSTLPKMSAALFKDFPGESGRTIVVK